MSFCTACGKSLDGTSKFCPACGAPVTIETQTPSWQPANSIYPVETESVYTLPPVSGGTKAMGIVGMALGIEALATGIIGLLYTLVFLSFDGAVAFGYGFTFGLIVLASAIVGKVLCNKSESRGNYAKPCSIGLKMSTFGIILGAVTLFLAFCGLLSM